MGSCGSKSDVKLEAVTMTEKAVAPNASAEKVAKAAAAEKAAAEKAAAEKAAAPRTGESALCTKSSFRLWDTSEALPDDPSLYVGDGIHPSPAGAARLATAVAEKLRHCLRVCEYPGACAQ